MTEKPSPSGFVCTCGQQHKFALYVSSHWTDRLSFICRTCGTRWGIWKGVATSGEKKATPFFIPKEDGK